MTKKEKWLRDWTICIFCISFLLGVLFCMAIEVLVRHLRWI
jgi:type IV secretory pathway component VirB8